MSVLSLTAAPVYNESSSTPTKSPPHPSSYIATRRHLPTPSKTQRRPASEEPVESFYDPQSLSNLNPPEYPHITSKLKRVQEPSFTVAPTYNETTDAYRLDKTTMTPAQVQQYYRTAFPTTTSAPSPPVPVPEHIDAKKINYIIHLLETQQNDRTGKIKEDIVLYAFLGIFIIFISDSFVRIGQYMHKK